MLGSVLIWLLCLAGFAVLYVFAPSAVTLTLAVGALLLPLLAAVLALLMRGRVHGALQLPEEILKRQDGKIVLKLQNDGILPFLRVRAELFAENILTGECSAQTVNCVLPARGKTETAVGFFAAHCGMLRLRLRRLAVYDLFGLVPIPVACDEKAELLILPETFEPRLRLPLRSGQSEESDSYSQDKPGFDYAEVFQVREYREGDSPKQIHWKLTTKFDDLMVRDPGLPQERTVLLYWERGCAGETPAQTDAMAEVLVSVLRGLLRQGVRCAVAWNGPDSEPEEHTLRMEDELYDLLPKLLQARRADQEGLDSYLRLYGPRKSGKVIFLAARTTPLLESLCPPEALTVLLCTDAAEESAGRSYCFPADSFAEALDEIDLY